MFFSGAGSEPVRRKGAAPREAVLTPLAFSNHPSTSGGQCPGELTGRRAYGENNPSTGNRHVGNRSTLNLFATDENTSPSPSVSDTYNFSRKGRANPNVETTSSAEFPTKGIKRIEPPCATPRNHGVRMVDTNVSSRFRNIAVVGTEASDEYISREARLEESIGGKREPREVRRPESASAPVNDCFRMDQTFGSADPNSWPVPKSGLKAAPKMAHIINRCQKIRLAVSDHIQARHGSLSDFFFQLCRGVVGHVGLLPRSPHGEVHMEALRRQLSAVISIPISEEEMYTIILGGHPEDVLEDDEELPMLMNYSEFAAVFGDGPKLGILRAHKI